MDSSKFIKLAKEDGWYLVNVRGRHHQFKHPTKKGRLTVPHPQKDLPKGTLGNMMKQAQLT